MPELATVLVGTGQKFIHFAKGILWTVSDHNKSSETPEQRVVQNQGDQEEADEPEWEAMVKNIRDQIRSQGGTDKIEFIYSRNGN